MLQYLRLIAIYGFILSCIGFIAMKSHAQTFPAGSNSVGVLSGDCICQNGDKSWPCRQVRGDPGNSVLTVNPCWGGGYKLVCPEDRSALCQYVGVAPTCSEPPLSNVCYPGDEPR